MGEEEGKKKVCVTAANGYIGSFMLKNLLHRGYIVHATLRDPDNPAKTGHLLSLPGAKERLHLFKADLFQHGSFDAAIQGCDFVINLATAQDTQPDWVQPTIEGTLDILRACKKEKTVRRVVHASSLHAAYPLNEKGENKELLDESCWSPLDYIRSKNSNFAMYCVAKTLAERAALRFGEEEQIEVVTVLIALVAGSSFPPTLPSGICYMLAPFTGDKVMYDSLVSDQSLLGSMSLVHVEDVCNAHIFLMEHPSAAGRYVCCSDAMTLDDVVDFFRRHHPEIPLVFGDKEEDRVKKVAPISSKKLTDLGFCFKYGMEETLRESFECAKQMKIL